MFKQLQKMARGLIVLTVSIFTIVCLLLAWYVYGIHLTGRTIPPAISFWMDHSWVTTSPHHFDTLKEQIADHFIDELYFHVGPFSTTGQLADDLSIPVDELDSLSTVNYAWMGQIRSEINLDDPAVRSGIVASAQWIEAHGFDGVHLDIEPIRGDDTAFIELLKELRAALPQGKISVAMDEWQSSLLSDWAGHIFGVSIQSYWSTDEVKAVAPYVDELVVMTYDTGFHDPKLYEWWVEQQTVALSQIVPETVTIRIGIPAYSEGASFDPLAENLSTGLAGFERGVQNVRSDLSRISGIAVYPYWEMDDTDWQTLKNL